MLSNMACSLIKHKRISTTLAKAKALKVYVEPLITKSKAANNETITKITKTVTVKHRKPEIIQKYGEESQVERTINIKSSTPARRLVFSYLKDNAVVNMLFGEIAAKVADRQGGYTRIIRTGFRPGDAAEMCFIELVDYNENMLKQKTAKKTTRTRRSSKKKEVADKVAETTPETVETAPETVEPTEETAKE